MSQGALHQRGGDRGDGGFRQLHLRRWLDRTRQDARFAFRLFARQKTAVGIAVGGLAVAVGLCTALFGVMNAMLFRTLSAGDVESLHWVRKTADLQVDAGGAGVAAVPAWTWSEVSHLREQATTARIAGVLQTAARMETTTGVVADSAPIWFVGADFFPMTGGRAAAGRLLTPADDQQSAPAPLVLNHAFWIRRFGGASGVLGSAIRLNGRPFTIVGIADRRFSGPTHEAPAFWAPLAVYDADWRDGARLAPSGRAGWALLVRVAPGTAEPRVEAELSALLRALHPAASGGGAEPAIEMQRPDARWNVRYGSAISASIVLLITLVLLLGCGNVANLLVAGAVSRRSEFGVRLALGATRGRVVRQMLTESLLLGVFGAAGGLLLASWLTPIVAGLVNLPATYDLSPDYRTYSFLAGAAMITGLTAGLAPARYGGRRSLGSVLGRDTTQAPAGTGRFHTTVIAVQAAVAMLMLVLGASLVRGAWQTSTVETGMDLDRLLEVRWTIHANLGRPPGQQLPDLGARRLRTLPFVQQAAVSGQSPLGGSYSRLGFGDDGRVRAYVKDVSPDYFETLGIPLEDGRTFTAAETAAEAPVAIVSARLARALWPGASPVGDRLDRLHRSLAGVQVIGVAGEVLAYSVADAIETTAAIYRPLADAQPLRTLIVRTRGSAAEALAGVRAALVPLDPQWRPAIGFPRDVLARQIEVAAVPSRIATVAVAAILVLAAIGIYGLTTFTVGLRRREIAVRMALGAGRQAIVTRVLADGLRPVVAGLVAGIGLAWLAGRWLGAILLGVSALDPWSIAIALVVLLAVAGGAILAPARRSTRLDPAVVLRPDS